MYVASTSFINANKHCPSHILIIMLLSIFTQSIVHIYIVEHIKLDIVYILMGFALPTSAMWVTQALTQCVEGNETKISPEP